MWWFKFNDYHSKDNLNIELLEKPKILISSLRTEFTDIVGRDGFLSYSDGSYEGFEHTLKCFLNKDSIDLDEVFTVLQNGASGKLVLCNRPDRYHKAIINNKISIDQFIENECYEFPLTFKCQPFSYLLSGEEYIQVTNGMKITNLGKLVSKPKIIIEGQNVSSTTLTIGDKTVSFESFNGKIVIDTELQECTLNGEDYTYYMKGDFLELPLGTFEVNCSGSASIKIQPNWICL